MRCISERSVLLYKPNDFFDLGDGSVEPFDARSVFPPFAFGFEVAMDGLLHPRHPADFPFAQDCRWLERRALAALRRDPGFHFSGRFSDFDGKRAVASLDQRK